MAITLIEALAAVAGSGGNHTTIAQRLNCSRTNISKLKNKWARLAEAIDEAKEARTDWVESQLDERIAAGDTTAMIFYLKTQGKRRGYVERQEITGAGGGSITVNWGDDTEDRD